MNLSLTDTQKLLTEAVSRLLEQESSPARVRAAEPLGFDPALWKELVSIGLPVMRCAEDLGGGGLSLFDAVLVAELAGRFLASAPLIESIVASRLLAQTDSSIARDWLAKVGSGSAIVSLALKDVRCEAQQLVPGGAVADGVLCLDAEALVLCTTSGPKTGVPNLGSLPLARWNLAQTEPSVQRTVLASGAPVRAMYLAAVEEWKLLNAAALSAVARQALDMAAAYARERTAFDRLIGSYQGLAHPLADAVTEVDGARLLVWNAASAIAKGSELAAADVSMACWWVAQATTKAVTRALHAFGGYGVTLEYDIQLYFRRGRALSLLNGDPRDELGRVADRLWGADVSTPLPDGGGVEIDFDYGEEAERMSAEAREFFEKNMTDELREFAANSSDGHHPEFMQKLAQAGLLFPDWPKQHGGRECGPYELTALHSVIADYGWESARITVTDMVGKMVMRFATEEAKREILPRLASGEAHCCLGYTEPSGGSDIFAAKTRAVRDGDAWVINGQKLFTTMGHHAHYVLLIARSDPNLPKHAGLTLFIVPLNLPGFEAQAVQTVGGERTNITYYSDMRVPDRYRLGEVNGGNKVMAAVLTLEHGGAAGEIYSNMLRILLQDSIDWAKQSKREGRPLIEDSEVRARLARVAVHAKVQDVLTRRAFWAAHNGVYEKAFGPMAKLFGSESWVACSADLLDLAAPDVLIQERTSRGVIELHSRKSLHGTVYAGTSEVQRSIIAESALALPRTRT